MASGTYEADYFAWCREQAARLRANDLSSLDRERLAEELESLGSSERSELESRLTVLIAHLLKYRYQPELRGTSWMSTLQEQRIRIARRLRKSPSLGPLLPEIVADLYGDAARVAYRETGIRNLPPDLPFAIEDILSDDFYPD